MNQSNINSHSIDITPSVSDDGSEEFYDICHEIPNRALKRARHSTTENTIHLDIGTRYTPPNPEMENINKLFDKLKEKMQQMLHSNKPLFYRTVNQLKDNFTLMITTDLNDAVSIFEKDPCDEYEKEVMENEFKKIPTFTLSTISVSGQKIMTEETAQRYEKRITDHKTIMTKLMDENTNLRLLKSNGVSEKNIQQLKDTEYCWLLHVTQSDEIRNNPEWKHSVDLYPNSNSANDKVLVESTTFNRASNIGRKEKWNSDTNE